MVKDLTDVYSELFHYTTASGLEGILRDKCLWATHCRYVNDSSEFQSFFGERLKYIVDTSVDETVSQLNLKLLPVAQKIKESGGIDYMSQTTKQGILDYIKNAKWDSLSPYFTSFCGMRNKDNEEAVDGLLSQWRGYGLDGGYAVVFDTKKLIALLNEEYEKHHYAYLRFGDVEYHHENGNSKYQLPEMLELEEIVKQNITQFLQTDEIDLINGIAIPIVALASTQKHHGFSEEREVRIISAPIESATLRKLAHSQLERKSPIEKSFHIRNGLFVPHLTLFRDMKLPIKRIIVGPHTDKLKRAFSLKMLLEKYEIDAEVTCSGIPYIGK